MFKVLVATAACAVAMSFAAPASAQSTSSSTTRSTTTTTVKATGNPSSLPFTGSSTFLLFLGLGSLLLGGALLVLRRRAAFVTVNRS